MPEMLITLTSGVIVAGATACAAVIWIWRRELAKLLGIGRGRPGSDADWWSLIREIETRIAIENALARAIEHRSAGSADLRELKKNASELSAILRHLKQSADEAMCGRVTH